MTKQICTCFRMRTLARVLLIAVTLLFTTVNADVTATPQVLYHDAVSGPVTGGENNLGCYLSVFGTNFGSSSGLGTITKVLIGGIQVANYRYLGPSKVSTKLSSIQQLTVQVGGLLNSSGMGPTMGTPLNIQVSVNGILSSPSPINNSSIAITFTPNPGKIYFVSLTGNDATGTANDINKPFRHLQLSSAPLTALAAVLKAGDHTIIRGGSWNDTGYDTAWYRWRYPEQQGSIPSGTIGTGWMHFTAYPGPINGNSIEDVHYTTPPGMKGGFQGSNDNYKGTTGDYVSISNLRMEVDASGTSDAAPINLQFSSGPWRAVNNELGPWPSNLNSKGAGVSGHGDGTRVYGNHIHHMACTGASENHGVYIDSLGANWEVAYNYIHDITGGNLIQLFDNQGVQGGNEGWPGFTGMSIHHNWAERSNKYGLNLAEGLISGNIYNNVIIGAQFAGLRFQWGGGNVSVNIAYNTFYDNDRIQSGSGNAQILNSNYPPGGGVCFIVENIFAAGPNTLASSSFYDNDGRPGDGVVYKLKRNLYWDKGQNWDHSEVTRLGDNQPIYANPLFTNPANGDFTLQVNSPAVNNATVTTKLDSLVNNDFSMVVSRPQGSFRDIGAFERIIASGSGTSSSSTGSSSSSSGKSSSSSSSTGVSSSTAVSSSSSGASSVSSTAAMSSSIASSSNTGGDSSSSAGSSSTAITSSTVISSSSSSTASQIGESSSTGSSSSSGSSTRTFGSTSISALLMIALTSALMLR